MEPARAALTVVVVCQKLHSSGWEGVAVMTATLAFSLIAFLLMLGVVADSLCGQRFWR